MSENLLIRTEFGTLFFARRGVLSAKWGTNFYAPRFCHAHEFHAPNTHKD